MNTNDARERFRQSLVGTWASYLGGGNDMLIGMRLTFHADGTGTMEEWGFDHQHLDPAYVSEPSFQWRTIGERRVEIKHRGETRLVSYDFKNTVDEYGKKELRLFDVGLKADERGEIGFWRSPFSLVYRGQNKNAHGIIGYLWRKLKSA